MKSIFFKKKCPKNNSLMDLYIIGPLGRDQIMFCPHSGECFD